MKITNARYAGSSTEVGKGPSRRLPEFAFIGRSNVGKSSLINALTGQSRLALTSSTPGKTKCINHFLINDSWYLVDLPGYGYAKAGKRGREAIADVISEYITRSEDMVMLFTLIDSRHDIGRIDLEFLSELGERQIPFAIIFTKCDKMGPTALKEQIDRDCGILSGQWEQLPDMLVSSAADGRGKEEILTYIENVLTSLAK